MNYEGFWEIYSKSCSFDIVYCHNAWCTRQFNAIFKCAVKHFFLCLFYFLSEACFLLSFLLFIQQVQLLALKFIFCFRKLVNSEKQFNEETFYFNNIIILTNNKEANAIVFSWNWVFIGWKSFQYFKIYIIRCLVYTMYFSYVNLFTHFREQSSIKRGENKQKKNKMNDYFNQWNGNNLLFVLNYSNKFILKGADWKWRVSTFKRWYHSSVNNIIVA